MYGLHGTEHELQYRVCVCTPILIGLLVKSSGRLGLLVSLAAWCEEICYGLCFMVVKGPAVIPPPAEELAVTSART